MSHSNNYSTIAKHDLSADIEKIKEKAWETRDAIAAAAHDAKYNAREFFQTSIEDAKTRTADLQENVVTYVKQNPVKAIGYSLLAGIVVALLLRH